AADRAFADRPGAAVDVNFGGRLAVGSRDLVRAIVIVFDVVAGDLQVADFTAFDANAPEPAIADVRPDDDCLVQIDLIEVNPHAGVVVDVAMADEHVASP